MVRRSLLVLRHLALLMAVAVVTVVVFKARAQSAQTAQPAAVAPIYGITLPEGYRNWRVISVAHEAGSLNDLRAVLGNDIAFDAAQHHQLPYPDGAIIARLAWAYTPSEENNKAFGREQSFVAGAPTNVQFMVKDSKRYASTGGWGYAQFNNGQPAPEAAHKTCAACHQPAAARDFVFTQFAP